MYGCERWTIKKAEHWRIDAFELWCWRRLVTHLDCKEIKPVNPKENQPWIFIGRTNAEAETPILWSPDVKNWFTWKGPDAGKDWRQEERGQQMMKWMDGITNSMDMSFSRLQELVWCSPCVSSNWTQLSDWTELNSAKDRRTVQRHTEPINIPKSTTWHCTAIQRDEIQLHQAELRYKLPQPGKLCRTLIQPHPWGQTPQPRRATTLRTFFFFP